MKVTLDRAGMLNLWRRHKGYAPAPAAPCGTVCGDGCCGDLQPGEQLDWDEHFVAQMDAWYLCLMRHGPLHLLPTADLTASAAPVLQGDGCMSLTLPDGTVRVAAVSLSGWEAPATVTDDPFSTLAMRQLHPFTRGTPSAPVAVLDPDGRLRLYPAQAGWRLTRLECVTHNEGTYAFDTAALHSWPKSTYND